ncbi:hypothetical protein TNIN_362011 [Trichonephila inaurata madagascariensis]|uniref:Uncharacterized protein n=1 Tax=Trichonephila inaurata madagascariensis TaxID=2747483 RepID=A0A8X6XHA8_9ARAC|nr:hypothetical protein TNIN_362011 [Trichonephila inaurata madagascariensis]
MRYKKGCYSYRYDPPAVVYKIDNLSGKTLALLPTIPEIMQLGRFTNIERFSQNTTTETYRNLDFSLSLNDRPKEASQFTDHRRCPLSSHKCHDYAKEEGRPVINPGRKQREAPQRVAANELGWTGVIRGGKLHPHLPKRRPG